MRIDFWDPDIPFSPTPSPTTSPDIFPRHFSLKHPYFSRERGYKDLYLLLRAHI